MANLITSVDVNKIKRISLNQNDARQLDPFITEAQNFDLKTQMGDAFFQDVVTNPGEPDNVVLLDGAIYKDDDGNDVEFTGIKAVLVYFAYGRYINGKNAQDTPHGFVNKTGENSAKIDAIEVSRQSKQAQAGAFALWRDVITFLNSNINDNKYPLWEGRKRTGRTNSVRISRMGSDRHHTNRIHDNLNDHEHHGHHTKDC